MAASLIHQPPDSKGKPQHCGHYTLPGNPAPQPAGAGVPDKGEAATQQRALPREETDGLCLLLGCVLLRGPLHWLHINLVLSLAVLFGRLLVVTGKF